MIYEIVNPSDAYTVETNDFEAAALACVLLGEGKYAFKPLEEGGEEIPMFMFGGHDEWFTKHFGRTVEQSLYHVSAKAIAEVMESVLIGTVAARRLFVDATAKMNAADVAEFAKKWHDEKRSSMNDIGGRAWKFAAAYREV